MTNNLGYFYNVSYYDNLFSEQDIKEMISARNESLRNFVLNRDLVPKIKGETAIELETTYPGLLAGTGMAHASVGEGGCALGFSFDYTTGLPYIPGSSVKGAIKRAFSLDSYIKELFGANTDVTALKREIFGESAGKSGYTAPERRDVFLDAFPICGAGGGRIMELDNITPHRNRPMGLLSDPNPITMLKVRPGVRFRFRFILRAGSVTVDKKKAAFEQILKDLGVGAKTNVGYGALVTQSQTRGNTTPQPAPGQPLRNGQPPRAHNPNLRQCLNPGCGNTFTPNPTSTRVQLLCPHCEKTLPRERGKCRICRNATNNGQPFCPTCYARRAP